MDMHVPQKKVNEIEETMKRIKMYKRVLMSSLCMKQKIYFENAISFEIDNLSKILEEIFKETENEWLVEETSIEELKTADINLRQQMELTEKELSSYDGTHGRPAYAAVDGVIYDVTNELSWGGGTHFGLAAGKDVTTEFKNCHNAKEVLLKLPKVGIVKKL